jgi:hypothetical protein
MVDQRPFFLEALTQVDNNTFPFSQHFKMTCDFLPFLIRMCLPPFEQLIRLQMVQFQDSIFERLHHHTLYNMFSNMIFEAHHLQFYYVLAQG